MSIRMNLTVDDDVPGLLQELAGGNKNMGAYLSDLIREVYKSKKSNMDNTLYLTTKIAEIERRLSLLEGGE